MEIFTQNVYAILFIYQICQKMQTIHKLYIHIDKMNEFQQRKRKKIYANVLIEMCNDKTAAGLL